MIRVRSHSIEEECIKLLEKYGITDYFFEGSSFLDVFNVRTHSPDSAKFAYRLSEYEGIENLLRNPELYDWLLIDSLTGKNILNWSLYSWAKQNGISICVKAPALNDLPYKSTFFQKCEKYDNITMFVPVSYLDCFFDTP